MLRQIQFATWPNTGYKGVCLAEKFALQKREIREKCAGLTSLLTLCGQISEDAEKQEQSVACSELYESPNSYIASVSQFPSLNQYQ